MTFKVHKVCAVCGAVESPRRRLVTIPELLDVETRDPGDMKMNVHNIANTYCLNRRCVVKATFELALARLREKNGR